MKISSENPINPPETTGPVPVVLPGHIARLAPSFPSLPISSFSQNMAGEIEAKSQVIDDYDDELKKSAQLYDTYMSNIYHFLPDDHDLQKEVEGITKEVTEVLNIPSNEIRVNLFENNVSEKYQNLAQAFINPITGNIYLSRSLFELLDFDKAKIRAVIAHELGHYLTRNAVTKDRNVKVNLNYDPIMDRVKTFQQEYFCDRVAVLVSTLFNEDPKAIANALDDFEKHEPEFIDQGTSFRTDEELSIIHSHPYSSRRIKAVNKLAKNLLSYLDSNEKKIKHRCVSDDFLDREQSFNRRMGRNSTGNFYIAEDIRKIYSLYQAVDDENLCESILKFLQLINSSDAKKLYRSLHDLGINRDIFFESISIGDLLEMPMKRIEALIKKIAELSEFNLSRSEIELFPDIKVEELNQSAEKNYDGDIRKQANQWFVDMVHYSHGSGIEEVFKTIKDEIAELSLPAMQNIFRAVNFRDINSSEKEGVKSRKVSVDGCEIVSHYLLNNYIKVSHDKGLSDDQILNQLFALLQENRAIYGVSFLQDSVYLCNYIKKYFNRADDEQKRKLIELVNENPNLSFSILQYDDNFLQVGETPSILETLKLYAKKNDLDFFSFNYESDLDTAVEARSNFNLINEISINLLIRLNYEPGSKNHFKYQKNNLLDIIDISYSKFDDNDLQELKSLILRKSLINFSLPMMQRDLDGALELVKDKTEEKLAAYQYSKEELKDFMKNQLPRLIKEDKQLLTKLSAINVNSLSILSIEDEKNQYSFLYGDKAFFKEYCGANRENYKEKGYQSLEKDIEIIHQLWLLWQRAFADDYQGLSIGKEKLSFLTETMPLACLSRDQKICQSLAWPSLDSLSDLSKIRDAINQSDDLDLLFQLRESFFNPLLVKTCEVKLLQVLNDEKKTVLASKFLAKEVQKVKSDLETLAPELVDDERLVKILVALKSRSNFKDELLKEFIDKANNLNSKMALGSLLIEPPTSSLRNKEDKGQTIVAESFLDTLIRVSAKDKAEALLYFIGARSFSSPWASSLLADTNENCFTEVEAVAKAKLVTASTRRKINQLKSHIEDKSQPMSDDDFFIQEALKKLKLFYRMPDFLMRLTKKLSVSPNLMVNFHDSVSSKKDQLEILEQVLHGGQGICRDEKIKKKFFLRVAKQFVRNVAKNQNLGKEKQEAMNGFISFALEHCPEQRLAEVFLSIWDISNKENQSMPDLISTLFVNLGPAFVKFGQRLATTNIPQDYKEAFRKLSNQNTLADTTTFYHNMDVAFQRKSPFDNNASGQKIGEGSMAATYKAKLAASNEAELKSKDEKQRAVKVIHPSIAKAVEEDVAFVGKLVGYMNKHKEDFDNIFLPSNTAEIIDRQLLEQIDTNLEIAKAKELEKVLSPEVEDCYFLSPEIDEENSRDGVLVSHYLGGKDLLTVDKDFPTLRNATALEVLRQIFQTDTYQADVNKGNFGLLVDEDDKAILKNSKPQVVFYDAGGVERIAKEDQKLFLQIIKAIAKNSKSLPDLLVSLIKDSDGLDKKKLSAELKTWLASLKSKTKSSQSAYARMKEVFESFIDKVSSMQMQLDDKWIVLSNCLSMLAPFLEGIDEKKVTRLMKDSMNKAGVLTRAESFAWSLGA